MLAAMSADPVAKERAKEHPEPRRALASDTPPRLNLNLGHHLKVLLVLNVLPLLGVLYLWWQWRAGRVTLRSMNEESKSTLIVVLLCGVAFAIIVWFVMPLARWLRDYPTWHLRRGPAWAWMIPTAGGWAAWILLSMAGILAATAAVLLAAIGFWQLFTHAT